MEYALNRLQEVPLSNRLIKETHNVLMRKGRGHTKGPGQFRRSQNWIGGTRPGNCSLRAATCKQGYRVHE